MPRTAITVTKTSNAGATHTWYTVDAVNGMEFINPSTQRCLVIIDNKGGAASGTMTIVTPYTKNDLALADQACNACAAGAIRPYGPPSNEVFGNLDGSTYKVHLDFTGFDANSKIAVVEMAAAL